MLSYDVYTIGYSGRSLNDFINLLKAKGVKIVVDVRLNPISRKPDFSKSKLKRALESSAIGYIHYPELGVPSGIRQRLKKTGDYYWFFKWYDENVIAKQTAKLNELLSLDRPFAVMCVESDQSKCHRSRIAKWLEKRGFRVYEVAQDGD